MRESGLLAWLLYVVIRLIFALMQVFPIDLNLRTARWLTRIWILLMPRHLERALAHLAAAFPNGLSAREMMQIARRCLESAAMFAVEAVCLPRLIGPMTWTRYIHLVNFKEALRIMLAGRGAILVTAHYGSFEVIGHLLAALRFKVAAVMRPFDNLYLNRFLIRTRRTHGLTLLDKKGAMAQAESLIRNGVLLAFIGDQDAGRKGQFADFFGRPASVYKSIGLLAITTGVPIVVGCARRTGRRARYEVSVQRIIEPREWQDQADALAWVTQAFTSAIEGFVRQDPAQYWWMHRRWKSRPRAEGTTPRLSPQEALPRAGHPSLR
jgi:KDO2-lipid IV(A) lauroyltransferase